MNSIQRVLAALTFDRSKHGKPDRVPCLPVPLMQGALVYGCSVEEYFAMPSHKIADAQIELNHMLNGIPDAVAGFPNVIEDVTGFGLTLSHHYANSTPAVDGMLIRDWSDIRSLKSPCPTDSDQLRKTRDLIADLRKKIGHEKVVLGAAIAPFSLPSMLMGTEKWMRLLFTPSLRDQYFDRIMDVCQRFVVDWATVQLRAGAHVVVLADGMASATLLPRRMFCEYAKPIIQRTIAAIPGMVAYESVGRIEPLIDDCRDLGAVALLIGEDDDIVHCKQRLQNKVAIIGNVNNMKMRRWSPARVEMTAKRALLQGMPGYGFALANQGPEIPFDTSVENIAALVSAVHKYGQYDQSQETGQRRAA